MSDRILRRQLALLAKCAASEPQATTAAAPGKAPKERRRAKKRRADPGLAAADVKKRNLDYFKATAPPVAQP